MREFEWLAGISPSWIRTTKGEKNPQYSRNGATVKGVARKHADKRWSRSRVICVQKTTTGVVEGRETRR
jgi:hypothetical protein